MIEIGFTKPVQLDAAAKKSPPTRFLILKDGPLDWAGADYSLDEESANAVIAEFERHGADIPIDYHHATKHAEDSPGTVKAPAAGWIHGLEYVKGEGLYAVDVEWTDGAAAEIAAKQFKYISPAIFIDKNAGTPLMLHSVALVNRPRTRGLTELLEAATRAAYVRSDDMPDPKKSDTKKNVKLDAAQDDVEQPGISISPEQKAMVKLAELLGLGDEAGLLEILQAAAEKIGGAGEGGEEEASKVAAALGLDKGAGVELVCAEARKLVLKAGEHEALARRIGELEAASKARAEQDAKAAAKALVDEQIKLGKLLPDIPEKAMKAALEFAQRDPEGFAAMYESAPVLCPPGQIVTASSEPGGRARIITQATSEYNENPQIAHGAPIEAYVDASLHDEGMTALTPAERKRFEGGD